MDLTRENIFAKFGITPDYAIILDSAGFANLVDAVGGVSMNVSKAIHYDDNAGYLHTHLNPAHND